MHRLVPAKKVKVRFDRPGRLDKKYKSVFLKRNIKWYSFRKLLYISILFVFIILVITFSYFAYSINANFHSYLNSTVRQINQDFCENYSNKNYIYSFMIIEYKQEIVQKVYLNILSEGKKFKIDFTSYNFQIDNSGSKGTISDLIISNTYFVQKDKIFQTIKSWFYREFKIKVDGLIVLNDIQSLYNYAELYSSNILERFRKAEIKEQNIQIQTDICQNTFNELIKDYFGRTASNEVYIQFYSNFQIRDILGLNNIKKEQVRIQIINATGVENWGIFIADLFTAYGLNVVKVDIEPELKANTLITVDRADLFESATVKQIGYLLINYKKEKTVDIAENIFADLRVTLGLDSLVN